MLLPNGVEDFAQIKTGVCFRSGEALMEIKLSARFKACDQWIGLTGQRRFTTEVGGLSGEGVDNPPLVWVYF